MTKFAVDDVLKPEVVRGVSRRPAAGASGVGRQRADRPAGAQRHVSQRACLTAGRPTATSRRWRSSAAWPQLQKKQYAQAAAWFQLTLKGASDFLGAAFYLGAVHAANGRDNDAVGAWQMSLLETAARPCTRCSSMRSCASATRRRALDLIAEAPDAWPSDEARLRRVATAQAMLGQFEPALETLDALLAAPAPTTRICCSSRFRCSIASTSTRALPAADRHALRRLRASATSHANGSEAALVETWRRYVLR